MLATLLPTAFFAALDRGASATSTSGTEAVAAIVSDATRDQILRISRGIAVILLVMYVPLPFTPLPHFPTMPPATPDRRALPRSYVASRIYMHNPPGEGNALVVPHDAPHALKEHEEELREEVPLTNPWAMMIVLVLTIGVMAATAEFVGVCFAVCFVGVTVRADGATDRVARGEHRGRARGERHPRRVRIPRPL